MGLYFFKVTNYLLGGGLFVLANLSYGRRLSFSTIRFCPNRKRRGRRSLVIVRGLGDRLLGGGLLLALNLYLFSKAESFGLTAGQAVRISLGTSARVVGGVHADTAFDVEKPASGQRTSAGQHFIATGFKQLIHTISSPRYPQTLLFLCVLAYNRCNSGSRSPLRHCSAQRS